MTDIVVLLRSLVFPLVFIDSFHWKKLKICWIILILVMTIIQYVVCFNYMICKNCFFVWIEFQINFNLIWLVSFSYLLDIASYTKFTIRLIQFEWANCLRSQCSYSCDKCSYRPLIVNWIYSFPVRIAARKT